MQGSRPPLPNSLTFLASAPKPLPHGTPGYSHSSSSPSTWFSTTNYHKTLYLTVISIPPLNTILFNEILNCLSKPIQDYVHAKMDILNDGIAVIRDITTSFQQQWGHIRRDKHIADWMSIRIKKDEAFIDFYSRCLKLRNLSLSQGIPTTEDDLKHRFIMGLTAHFTSLQEKAQDLPEPWRTASIHQLPALAQEFLDNKNSIRELHRSHRGDQPHSPTSTRNNNDNNPSTTPNNAGTPRTTPQPDQATQNRQNAIYADIMAGTFQPSNYSSQVPTGACVYHGNAHPGGYTGLYSHKEDYCQSCCPGGL